MKRLLLFCLAALCSCLAHTQLLDWYPYFPKEDNASQSLQITVNAAKGNQGLLNHAPTSDVYVHIGVITNLSTAPNDWRYVKFNQNFNLPNPQLQAASIGNNHWAFTINGSLKTYFGVPANEEILKIAILFRSGNGSKKQANIDGSDMYIPVYDNSLVVRLDDPPMQPTFNRIPEPNTWIIGTVFPMEAFTNDVPPFTNTMKLYHNGVLVASEDDVDSLDGSSTIDVYGNHQLVAEINDGTTTVFDTVNIFVAPPASPVAPLPAGAKDGINYLPGDTAVILVLKAPGKNMVSVIGDFNNWTQDVSHIMNKTADGKQFWLRIGSLVPGSEYAYQYLVDGTIKIADPYAEKILDPFNDQFITSVTYPSLMPYPAGQTGIVSVLQTAKPEYNWAIDNFSRPDKRGLVIYELLLRDFISAHDWNTLRDSLNYLQQLGINAIELMPVNEFEGNLSWGYNPSFYFAPDKYYGTENSFKEFIDSCHSKGIAVIMDIALNHSFGQSPMVQLYWDAANNRPAADNPWYNPVPKHAFNVGYDMNHESAETRYFTSRVLEHWTHEYKIDGFRFDLSKGFTQNATCDANGNNCDVGAWGNPDQSRINIWKAYYDTLQLKSAGSYAILEHFANNNEEEQLSEYGMLLWGNMNHAYSQASKGNAAEWDFSGGIHSVRTWNDPHLVTYMESHDEERIVYRNIQEGHSSGTYNVRDTTTALKRMELNAAFMFTIPGPKMIWQFGELGYPYSINTCTDGSVNPNCRLDPKPIRWDYLDDPRRKSIYDTYSKLINLRSHPWYKEVFLSGSIDQSLNGAGKWMKVSSGDSSHVIVVGNFGLGSLSASIAFPETGTWYNVLDNSVFSSTGTPQSISLLPGEYRVYVNRNINNVTVTPVIPIPWMGNEMLVSAWPNPSSSGFNLDLDMPKSNDVTIELYNALGQYVNALYKGFLSAGSHRIALKNENISAGMYYLKITTKDASKTIQVTFNK